MRIKLVAYPAIMMTKGGPTYKVFPLLRELKKLDVDVTLFDMWDQSHEYSRDEDLFHIFNASISTYPVVSVLNKMEIKYVVNPIFYSNLSPRLIRTYLAVNQLLRPVFRRSYSDYSLTAAICRQAVKVLPNTVAEGRMLHEALGIADRKIEMIANGVEARFYDANPHLFLKKFGIRDFILYVGHLGPTRKNGERILRALEKIDHPAVIIADITETPEGKWCRDRLSQNKNLHYLGWLDHDDPLLASAYAACKTFILPTQFETPGRAALEAALAGANIVITPRGGAGEYFLERAVYPDPLSVDSIVKAIEYSMNADRDPLLREHIRDRYTWDKIALQTLDIYKEVMEK